MCSCLPSFSSNKVLAVTKNEFTPVESSTASLSPETSAQFDDIDFSEEHAPVKLFVQSPHDYPLFVIYKGNAESLNSLLQPLLDIFRKDCTFCLTESSPASSLPSDSSSSSDSFSNPIMPSSDLPHSSSSNVSMHSILMAAMKKAVALHSLHRDQDYLMHTQVYDVFQQCHHLLIAVNHRCHDPVSLGLLLASRPLPSEPVFICPPGQKRIPSASQPSPLRPLVKPVRVSKLWLPRPLISAWLHKHSLRSVHELVFVLVIHAVLQSHRQPAPQLSSSLFASSMPEPQPNAHPHQGGRVPALRRANSSCVMPSTHPGDSIMCMHSLRKYMHASTDISGGDYTCVMDALPIYASLETGPMHLSNIASYFQRVRSLEALVTDPLQQMSENMIQYESWLNASLYRPRSSIYHSDSTLSSSASFSSSSGVGGGVSLSADLLMSLLSWVVDRHVIAIDNPAGDVGIFLFSDQVQLIPELLTIL